MATIVLGTLWADEGKGKLVDILSSSASLCIRAQGGNNAGYTIVADGKTLHYHSIPSGLGLANPKFVNLVGAGSVVRVISFEELDNLKEAGAEIEGRTFIAKGGHKLLPICISWLMHVRRRRWGRVRLGRL